MTPENFALLAGLDYYVWIEPPADVLEIGYAQYDYSGMWKVSLSEINAGLVQPINSAARFEDASYIFEGDGGPWHYMHLVSLSNTKLHDALKRIAYGEVVGLTTSDDVVGLTLAARNKEQLYSVAAAKLKVPALTLRRMFDFT